MDAPAHVAATEISPTAGAQVHRAAGERVAMRVSEETSQQPGPLEVFTSFARGLGVDEHAASRARPHPQTVALDPATLIPALIAFAADCGAERHECLYVSTPITTGRNQLDVAPGKPELAGFVPLTPEEQITANRRHAQQVAETLRGSYPGMVIEPSSLVDIPDWQQADYHSLWTTVLREYAKTVLFVDGWQYSVGCSIELGAAIELLFPMLTESRDELSPSAALAMLRTAVREVGHQPGNGVALSRALAVAEAAFAATTGSAASHDRRY